VRLTYAGTIFKLTSPRGLLGALRRLHEKEPDLARRIELRFIGRIVETELEHFAGTDELGVVRAGYIDHDRVLHELGASHGVLCLLDDVPGTERIYPAKIFELMRLGRPCLTLSPQGALTELVTRHRLGDVLPPRDEAAIAALLSEKIRAFDRGALDVRSHPVDVERYDRRALAAEFANVFRRAHALAAG
jgi:hypothetical protein